MEDGGVVRAWHAQACCHCHCIVIHPCAAGNALEYSYSARHEKLFRNLGFSIKEQPLIPLPPSKPHPFRTQLGFPLNANTMCRKVFTFFSHKFQNISEEKKKKEKTVKDLLGLFKYLTRISIN